MGMVVANDTDDAETKSSSDFLNEGATTGENGIEETRFFMEMLTTLDVDLAYCAEKLVNLDLYVTTVSLGDSGLSELLIQNSNISEFKVEKALIFDLSLEYLDSELADLGRFLNALRSRIIIEHQRLHSCSQNRLRVTAFQGKLHASESSWKHLRKQLSGLESQVSNMRVSLFWKISRHSLEDIAFETPGSDLQIAGQQRLVLRMLDKSLSGELDLEKQLLRSKEKERELTSKFLITNKVVSDLESFAEFALEKLLQAEHSSVIFEGITNDVMTHLQMLQFSLHCSAQREEELKSKLQSSLEKENRISLAVIKDSCEKLTQSSLDRTNLEQKVKVLEEKLQSSESKLQQVNLSYEISQAQLSMLENTVETLEGEIFLAETRAQIAEETFATLTEENIELREEVSFLKGGDGSVEKISLLENQVRELEVQLQTAKSSSEASHEQQNMLYKAIFDMEMLIEELTSKVSKVENRADDAEKECLALAETNLALNKEISYLRSNGDKLEGSLKESKKLKVAWAKDINSGAKLITEMVVQLASERERIQKQISSLARENKILLEELQRMRKICSVANQDDKEFIGRDYSIAVADNPNLGSNISVPATEDVVETQISMTASNQVDEREDQDVRDEASTSSNSSVSEPVAAAATNFKNEETERKAVSGHINSKCYTVVAGIVILLSFLALNINWQDIASTMAHHYLGFQ